MIGGVSSENNPASELPAGVISSLRTTFEYTFSPSLLRTQVSWFKLFYQVSSK